MKRKISIIITIVAALVFLFLAGRFGFTVVTIEAAEEAVQSEEFDPVFYVDSIWDSQLMPAFNENGVDLATVLSAMEPDENGNALKDDLIGVAEQYGLITVGEAHTYLVKGTGKIVSVNAETSLGVAEVSIDGYNGPIKVLVYVGTRIPSGETSVRDAVGFIEFGDFKEQTEYGKAASEINKRVLSTVLEGIDRESLVGKTVSFEGAFTIRTFNLIQIDISEINIVPVQFDLGED